MILLVFTPSDYNFPPEPQPEPAPRYRQILHASNYKTTGPSRFLAAIQLCVRYRQAEVSWRTLFTIQSSLPRSTSPGRAPHSTRRQYGDYVPTSAIHKLRWSTKSSLLHTLGWTKWLCWCIYRGERCTKAILNTEPTHRSSSFSNPNFRPSE